VEEGTGKRGRTRVVKPRIRSPFASEQGLTGTLGGREVHRTAGEEVRETGERRRSGKRPTRVDRRAVGSGNRGASGETDERNGRKSHVGLPSAVLRIGPV
jgi:hypothetical protein